MAQQTSETPVLDLLAGMTALSLETSTLDTQGIMLARIAALVATDAPPITSVASSAPGNSGRSAIWRCSRYLGVQSQKASEPASQTGTRMIQPTARSSPLEAIPRQSMPLSTKNQTVNRH